MIQENGRLPSIPILWIQDPFCYGLAYFTDFHSTISINPDKRFQSWRRALDGTNERKSRIIEPPSSSEVKGVIDHESHAWKNTAYVDNCNEILNHCLRVTRTRI